MLSLRKFCCWVFFVHCASASLQPLSIAPSLAELFLLFFDREFSLSGLRHRRYSSRFLSTSLVQQSSAKLEPRRVRDLFLPCPGFLQIGFYCSLLFCTCLSPRYWYCSSRLSAVCASFNLCSISRMVCILCIGVMWKTWVFVLARTRLRLVYVFLVLCICYSGIGSRLLREPRTSRGQV